MLSCELYDDAIYMMQYTLYNVQRTTYILSQCTTLYVVRYTLFITNILYNVQCNSVHRTLYIKQLILYTQCTLYIIHCILYTYVAHHYFDMCHFDTRHFTAIHSRRCTTWHSSSHLVKSIYMYTVFIIHLYTLYNVHCTLCSE